jgi:hypothetical protein
LKKAWNCQSGFFQKKIVSWPTKSKVQKIVIAYWNHFVMKIEKSMKILMAVFNLIFVQIYDENWNVMGKV